MTREEIEQLIKKLESLTPTIDILNRLELLRSKLNEL
jgi:hypothetical protein